MAKNAIQPTREQNYAEWYQQVIKAADLAENSAVRGCMVIKPWGYALWEGIQSILDRMFKETGHENAYFPLFIPKSFLEKEAQHVNGFAKECAVVTHSRLVTNEEGKLVPASPLEEPLIVRPTSETIIGESFSRWVQSYRDLPILINQWANVVRWEMRTRLFLRTAEFLWQEGHTAHATAQEAWNEATQMLEVYRQLAEDYMAMPVICGKKTASERFPGADETFCIEAMMQDGKALQAGTSHFLGQHFSKAFGIQFLSETGQREYAWTSSFGVSTRLIGGLIMSHSDDDGLVLPPKLAPLHVVILPVIHNEADRVTILKEADLLQKELESQTFAGAPIRVKIDHRDLRGGEKSWQWIKKGVPVRIELGPRDIEQQQVFCARRDTGEKKSIARGEFVANIAQLLQEIQNNLFQRAQKRQKENTVQVATLDELKEYFAHNTGFVESYFCGDPAIEEMLKKELAITIRCIPLATEKEQGPCLAHPECQGSRVIWAKSY